MPGQRLFRSALQAALKVKVKGHFVLPEGSPSRAGSRPGPAPALSGKHNRPPKAGSLSKSVFLTDRTRFAPGSARPLAASLRLALENAFASAFVMPLKVKTQVKTKVIKNKSLNKRQKRFNFLASGFRFQVSGFRFLGCGLWALGFGLWVLGFGFWVWVWVWVWVLL